MKNCYFKVLSVSSVKVFAVAMLAIVSVQSSSAHAELRGRLGGMSAAGPAISRPRPGPDFAGGGNSPEPASVTLLLMGAGAVGARLLKKRKNKDNDQA